MSLFLWRRKKSGTNLNEPSPVEKGDRAAVDEENGLQTTIWEYSNPCMKRVNVRVEDLKPDKK